MKGHKPVTLYTNDLGLYNSIPWEEFKSNIDAAIEEKGIINPCAQMDYYDYDAELCITGFRPMTEAEKEKARLAAERAAAAKARAKEKREAKERAMYEKLKAKFGE